MYFPHLFARRAELLAIRDACGELPISNTVVPVLEPVKSDSGDLRRCLEVLGQAGVRTAVITNPTVGDFADAINVEPWRESLSDSFQQYPSLLPAFVCRAATQLAEVTNFLDLYPGRDVALLYWSPNLTNIEIQNLVAQERIQFHINLHGQMSAAQRMLLPTNKAVDIFDHFNHLTRNADYGGQEFFSDDHLNFATSGIGYGDYSVIGFRFVPGGGPAHAVAIHVVYRVPTTGTLWVEHFISDDIDIDIGSTAGKYLQAAGKLVAATAQRPAEFGHNNALNAFAQDVHGNIFPGLTTNKRRQILHHIALNHHMLNGGL